MISKTQSAIIGAVALAGAVSYTRLTPERDGFPLLPGMDAVIESAPVEPTPWPTMTVTWDYPTNEVIDGFRLYHRTLHIYQEWQCINSNIPPSARSVQFQSEQTGTLAITAVRGGLESDMAQLTN